jgi:hypothetical protein
MTTRCLPCAALCLLLPGCGEPEEGQDTALSAEELLVDLVEAHGAVFEALHDHVGSQGLDWYDTAAEWPVEGEATLDSFSGVTGSVGLAWSVDLEADEHEGFYDWYWTVSMSDGELTTAAAAYLCAGDWDLRDAEFESSGRWDDFAGTVSIDGADLEEVSYEATWWGPLYSVRGSLGGDEVDWEDPNGNPP